MTAISNCPHLLCCCSIALYVHLLGDDGWFPCCVVNHDRSNDWCWERWAVKASCLVLATLTLEAYWSRRSKPALLLSATFWRGFGHTVLRKRSRCEQWLAPSSFRCELHVLARPYWVDQYCAIAERCTCRIFDIPLSDQLDYFFMAHHCFFILTTLCLVIL